MLLFQVGVVDWNGKHHHQAMYAIAVRCLVCFLFFIHVLVIVYEICY